MTEVLEVKVTWGTQVLALRHLEAGARFAIGDTEIVGAPDGGAFVSGPGADTFGVRATTPISMEVEGVTIELSSVHAEDKMARGLFPLATAAAIALSFLAHVTVMATMASFPPPPQDEGISREQLLAMRALLDAADERETEEKIEDAPDPRRTSPGDEMLAYEPRPWDPSVPKGPILRESEVSSTGKLPTEIVQRIVRQNFGRIRLCYQKGLRKNPKLEGLVTTNLVIGRDGAIKHLIDGGSDLPDAEVVACVVRTFEGLSFPAPESGIVTASYPISFAPGD